MLILLKQKGQCYHPLNVIFLYASNNTHVNGYVMSHESSREEMRLNFINDGKNILKFLSFLIDIDFKTF